MASAKASVVFTGKLVSGIRRQAEEAAQAAGFIVHKCADWHQHLQTLCSCTRSACFALTSTTQACRACHPSQLCVALSITCRSVKASTTYLVVGDLVVLPPNCFRKNKEAARRGTKVLTEREWEAVLAATVAAGADATTMVASGSAAAAAGCRKRSSHEAQGGKEVAEKSGQKGKAGAQAGTAARKGGARSEVASGGSRDGKHVEVVLDVCDDGDKEEEEKEAGTVKRQRTRPATRGAAAAAAAAEAGGGGKGDAQARTVIN